jgi:hypothetical protein
MLVLAMEFSRGERAESTLSEEAPHARRAEQSLPQNGIEDRPGSSGRRLERPKPAIVTVRRPAE